MDFIYLFFLVFSANELFLKRIVFELSVEILEIEVESTIRFSSYSDYDSDSDSDSLAIVFWGGQKCVPAEMRGDAVGFPESAQASSHSPGAT